MAPRVIPARALLLRIENQLDVPHVPFPSTASAEADAQ